MIGTTCTECKYHFYSDCYLECSKHDRINNDNSCKDFEWRNYEMKNYELENYKAQCKKYYEAIKNIVFYNGLYKVLEKVRIELDQEPFTGNPPEWFCRELTRYADLQAVWILLVSLFGDYGTSPRYGWITEKRDFDMFVFYLVRDEEGKLYE